MTSTSGAIGSSRGSACGSAPWAPAATIDGKLGPFAPSRRISQLQVDRHIALGAPDETAFQDVAQRLVGQLGGGADAGDLASVLDRAQALDGARAGNELPCGGEQLAQMGVLGDREARVVETEPSGVTLGVARDLSDGARAARP